jgi:hypothetical protein
MQSLLVAVVAVQVQALQIKAEVAEHAAEAGPFQHLMPSTSSMSRDLRTADEVARDLFADPISRDSERMKVSRPGLAARGTTLHKGDRLGTAAERGDTQQIIKLLKKGVDPNFQNAASGVTPLGVACERGHVGAIKALLDEFQPSHAIFIDDLPPNHSSAKDHVPHVHCIHMVAETPLRGLIPAAPHADVRIDDWHEALPHIETLLKGLS